MVNKIKCNIFFHTLKLLTSHHCNVSSARIRQLFSSTTLLDEKKIFASKSNSERDNIIAGFDVKKAKLISLMNFNSAEDAMPFYRLPMSKLLMIFKRIKLDEDTGFSKNRLYYIADRIQQPASLLCEPVSQRTFVYTLSSQWLTSSIDVLMEFGIPGERIARDLWVLKYHHATIRRRLQLVRARGVDNLYPWMVRCSQDILDRSIQISLDTKNILGDNLSTQMYLAKRLNVPMEAVEEMCARFPSLRTIRVTKVKSFLDYLTRSGFSLEEIARTPRVLTGSQRTVARRVEQLRALGRPAPLAVLCRSVAGFAKYCQTLKFAAALKEPDKNY